MAWPLKLLTVTNYMTKRSHNDSWIPLKRSGKIKVITDSTLSIQYKVQEFLYLKLRMMILRKIRKRDDTKFLFLLRAPVLIKKMRMNSVAKFVQFILDHSNPNISYGLYDDVKVVKMITIDEKIIVARNNFRFESAIVLVIGTEERHASIGYETIG